MITIIISACLISDPGTCKDYRIPLEADIDETKCAYFAPPHFGKWADEHPGWTIKKWRCTPGFVKDT